MYKRINISVTLVSESYVILYCEKNVIRNSPIKICLNQEFVKIKFLLITDIMSFFILR